MSATPLDKVEVKPLQLVKMIHADTERYARELAEVNNRTVQNWFNGTRQPAPWLERLIVKEIQAATE